MADHWPRALRERPSGSSRPGRKEAFVSDGFGIPIGRVHSVVTLYHLFRTKPAGRHAIRLCLGTACHVLSAETILTTLEEGLNI